MTPPGWPDFMSRARFARAGRHVIEGRAWSGRAAVTRVEVSTDGGVSWRDAMLDPEVDHPRAWRRWTYDWSALPGDHELLVRASDAAGSQPVEPEWNRQGMANNLVQRVPVTVLA
jgi:hypothetical protein